MDELDGLAEVRVPKVTPHLVPILPAEVLAAVTEPRWTHMGCTRVAGGGYGSHMLACCSTVLTQQDEGEVCRLLRCPFVDQPCAVIVAADSIQQLPKR